MCAQQREKKRVSPCLHQQLKPSFHRLSTPQYCTLLSLRPISFPIFCLHRATVSPGWLLTLPLISLCLPAALVCYDLSDRFIHSSESDLLFSPFQSLKILWETLKICFPNKKFKTRISQEYINSYIILKSVLSSLCSNIDDFNDSVLLLKWWQVSSLHRKKEDHVQTSLSFYFSSHICYIHLFCVQPGQCSVNAFKEIVSKIQL